MTLDNFTIKAQEAVNHAAELTKSGKGQAITAVHLLSGLLRRAKA